MPDSSKPISPLRQRMIEDMTLRRLSPKTQVGYLRAVVKLTRFLKRSPDTATDEDLRLFQLHMSKNGVSNTTINATITGLRFLFEATLDDQHILRKMSSVRVPRKLPVVLNAEEISKILDAVSNPKYKAALALAYATGLRSSEITHLSIRDIDSKRMIIHVRQGKGDKDRYALLSPELVKLLQQWWLSAYNEGKISRSGWLFPGKTRCSHDHPTTQQGLSCSSN